MLGCREIVACDPGFYFVSWDMMFAAAPPLPLPPPLHVPQVLCPPPPTTLSVSCPHTSVYAAAAPRAHRLTDLCGDSKKAKTYVNFLVRQGNVKAVVEHVFGGSRFKVRRSVLATQGLGWLFSGKSPPSLSTGTSLCLLVRLWSLAPLFVFDHSSEKPSSTADFRKDGQPD